ncbi:MAG: Septum site-determining protein MinC [uncultured Thiotrichaceae bacterium]|uniref:Probable septum site-determining protein MinC n=1 Tax=uncultured Thiotrichaceae bacterium TaxID=298394 RepID=A0A6S6TNI0_9GAMM|nr:MAG: Septum site-determining protein MinC [uncultured Thiotrichaceae bacterium]
MSSQAFELKGEMSLLSVLLLSATDMSEIQATLDEKRENAHQLLDRSPVIVDCQKVSEQAAGLDFVQLRKMVAETGLIPVGIRNLPEALENTASESGWALLRQGHSRVRATTLPEKTEVADVANADAVDSGGDNGGGADPVQRLRVVQRPVRSGQQIYCPDGDIVVMQQTSAGSELLAGGSVHVYGALRGRVLAGVQGDKTARIFCQNLEAELLSIAGRYRLLDDIEDDLKGQAVMVYLEGEKLKIAPI